MNQTRRNFFNGLLGISFTTFLPTSSYACQESLNKIVEPLLPKALKEGATIALIAPGYSFTTTTLKQMGYNPYHTKRVSKRLSPLQKWKP
jgi:hypothetical protein